MDGSGLAARERRSARGDGGGGPRQHRARPLLHRHDGHGRRSGKMDPIVGRDDEIRQIIDVLMRRRQNNPILTGEAGVGKTAVVEGFAQRLASGDVPPQLKGVRLCALDIGLMQAGASMKGEFEQRLRSVIDEVQASPTPIILFIDEAHTLIGAGGAQGTGDAANLLKPALARGTLRTIGATTWDEYRQLLREGPGADPALPADQRRRAVDREVLLHAARHPRADGEAPQVRISDEAVVAAVQLSARYIPARQLPDKAVSLLDTACARVAISPEHDAGGDRRPQGGDRRRARRSSTRSERESDHRPLRRGAHRRAQGRDRRDRRRSWRRWKPSTPRRRRSSTRS